MFQTGFPMTILSSFVGPLRLDQETRDYVFENYAPWAIQASCSSKSLINVMYEDEFDRNLNELRIELNIFPPKFIQ